MGVPPAREKPDTTLTISVHPLAPGVYAAKIRYGWVGWIEQGDGIVLVDAAMDDRAAAALEDSIRSRSGSKPIRYVVVTHAHEDHVLGAKRFLDKGATLIAQANAGSAVDSILGREHQTKAATKGAEPTTIEVKHSYTLGKGARAAQIIYLGHPAHTWGDLIVYLPKQKVLFAGDIVSYRAVPWMLDPGMSRTGWMASVDSILGPRFAADSLVPGHGQIGPRVKAASWMKHYLVDAWEKAKGVAVEGGKEMAFRDWGYLGAYEDMEFYQETHFMNMRRLYREARGMNAPGRPRARALKY
jgi:cyclase